jgi:hypothetical protein
MYERDRLESLGRLTPEEKERLTAVAERWWAEARRLYDLPFDQRHADLDD